MRKKIVFSLVVFVSALLFVFSGNTVYAETIPDKPPLTGVYDPHGYLSDDVIKEVAVLNQSYSKTELKPQIAVAIVDEVDGNIESVANETAKKWKIGFSDTNYGTLVLISVKERKIRTETSNNMGAIIPDSTAQELNDTIKNDFRNEDYSSGMLKYLSKAEAVIKSSLLEGKQNVKKEEYLSNELVEQIQKNEKEYNRKQGRIGAIIFGVSILIFIFIGIKITKLQKEENEYYEWKKKYPSSSNGSGSISYHSASRPYDSFSSSSSFDSSSSYDSSSSSSSSSSWSGGGFDGGGSSGSW